MNSTNPNFIFDQFNKTVTFTNLFDISNTSLWREINNIRNDIFEGFTNIISIIAKTIDALNNINVTNNYPTLVISNISSGYRRIIYKEFDNFGIKYHKVIKNTINNVDNVDILININNIWTIEDFTLNIYSITFPNTRFQSSDDIYNFYSSITILNITPERKIIVSLYDYIKYRKFFFPLSPAHILSNQLFLHSFNSFPRTLAQIESNQSNQSNQSNDKIKFEISDLIFDIKDKLSDKEFKFILEKLQQIH